MADRRAVGKRQPKRGYPPAFLATSRFVHRPARTNAGIARAEMAVNTSTEAV
jgi:hypothetical protein